MKKFAIALLLVVALTLGLAGIATAASAPRATGGGRVDYGYSIITIAFTAKQVNAATGAAKGQFEYYSVLDKFKAHGKVLYLAVEGNNAWIGVVITECTDTMMIGDEYVFEVQDNGEGKKATGPDFIGGVLYAPASDALSKPDLSFAFVPWFRGNIQVFPGE